jgi:hypothetical protein
VRIFRSILIAIVTALFCYLGYYLYQRQQNQYALLSFQLPGQATNIVVQDLSKLVNKVNSADDLQVPKLPNKVASQLAELITASKHSELPYFGERYLLSYTDEDFIFVIQHPNYTNLSSFLGPSFNASLKSASVPNTTMILRTYGDYLVVSSTQVNPVKQTRLTYTGNADYILYADTAIVEKHIVTSQNHFLVWQTKEGTVRGNPVGTDLFIAKTPKHFDTISFYGSTRMNDDKYTFFNQPKDDLFNWVSEGVMIIRKGEFTLLIGQQNDQRDLRLILEEETISNQSDTFQLEKENLKGFEIMQFNAARDWHKSIKEISEPLNYYTAFENFNILSNSKEAMNWYLSEAQTGRLIDLRDPIRLKLNRTIPNALHILNVYHHENGDFQVETHTWTEKWVCTHTTTNSGNAAPIIPEKSTYPTQLKINPSFMQMAHAKQQNYLLVNDDATLVAVTTDGKELWSFSSDQKFVQNPQVVDLENDGSNEVVLLTAKQLTILNSQGKVQKGFPVNLNSTALSVSCLNYDQAYNYRFFVNLSQKVICFNESGSIVKGWNFVPQKNNLLKKGCNYIQTQGKDYIGFTDQKGVHYVLNRRGENRFSTSHQFLLPNETPFFVASSVNDLRYMGYKNQYITNFYLQSGIRDSVKIDRRIAPTAVRWLAYKNEPKLILEEGNRIFILDQFGYVLKELLKPEGADQLIAVHSGLKEIYTFYDATKELIYFLNSTGKMLEYTTIDNQNSYCIHKDKGYVFFKNELKILNL